MYIQLAVFSEAKAGNTPDEWEDAAMAGVAPQPARAGQVPSFVRYVVADGATGGYASRRWANQLVTWFAPRDHPARGPRLEHASMHRWFGWIQQAWAANPPPTGDVIDEIKAKEGSFATLLGFELSGLDGPEPAWRAVALGDTVLFHVRAGQRPVVFPPFGPDDFDADPAGVHSLVAPDWMSERLLISGGELAPGDLLFAATDAMAHWIIRAALRDEEKTWATLSELVHPATFSRFVREQRNAGNPAEAMKNDDVTLLRLRMLADPPSYLLVCQ